MSAQKTFIRNRKKKTDSEFCYIPLIEHVGAVCPTFKLEARNCPTM